MAIRQIRVLGDDILRKTSKEVKEMTPRMHTLVEDMYDTMYEAMGVGLAAPQVTYIMNDLKNAGFAVDVNAITVEEARQSILKNLQGIHGKA